MNSIKRAQSGGLFVSALECRDIEMALYDRTYVFSILVVEAENTKVIMVAYEYTYQDHEYIIRTMNTKHEQCSMAFLLQAAQQDYCKLLGQMKLSLNTAWRPYEVK